MSLVIPTRQAESLRNERPLWPAGPWKGTFEEPIMRSGPPVNGKTGALLKGYVGPEAERLTLVVGDNEPLESQDDVGAQKQFVDIVLSDGPYSLASTPYDSIPDEAWQLQRSARILANLAAALGQVTLADDGESAVVNDDFMDALRAGAYTGSEIAYVIYHRVGSDKVKRAEIEMFLAA